MIYIACFGVAIFIFPLTTRAVLLRPPYSSSLIVLNSESDEGKPTLLISLDLSSAFEVIDHAILLKRLSHNLGVSSTAYSFSPTSVTDVRVGRHSSASTPCSVGVPQGSVLGQLLFSIYTSPIFAIA